MRNATLRRLLDDNARFDLTNRGTVNHLPMALYALARMGASDERLIEYFQWWEASRALPRTESQRPVEGEEWARHIGDAAMFSALWEFFADRVAKRGPAEVIGEVFPLVSGGIAAAAFHGLIRLAYGIEADHAGEIGAGLATLCSRHANLGIPESPCAATGIEGALARLSERLGGVAFAGQGIIGRMGAAAADPRFAAGFALPPIGSEFLGSFARIAIALYWQTGNFTVLHLVTATHAARVLFEAYPHLASAEALTAFWEAGCAAYASVGAPGLSPSSVPPESLPWSRIFADAVQTNDDHIIKLAYSCHCESNRYGNPLYQAAAARLVAAGQT
jgi:hypothetical protein